MIRTLNVYKGENAEKFILQLEDIQAKCKMVKKEEYFDNIITFYYDNDILKYVFFTDEKSVEVLHEYIIELIDSNLEEVAEFISNIRKTRKERVLEDIQ